MSWDILLIRTQTYAEDFSELLPEQILPWEPAAVWEAVQAMGRAEPAGNRLNIWLEDTTCVEVFAPPDDRGKILSVHFSIGGRSEQISPYLALVQSQLGGRYYDVSNQSFVPSEPS